MSRCSVRGPCNPARSPVGRTRSFVAATVKGMKLPPLEHLATHSTLMTLQHLLKSLAFGFLGFAFVHIGNRITAGTAGR